MNRRLIILLVLPLFFACKTEIRKIKLNPNDDQKEIVTQVFNVTKGSKFV